MYFCGIFLDNQDSYFQIILKNIPDKLKCVFLHGHMIIDEALINKLSQIPLVIVFDHIHGDTGGRYLLSDDYLKKHPNVKKVSENLYKPDLTDYKLPEKIKYNTITNFFGDDF